VLREKFNPRNINHMPAVKFFARLDLDQICLFMDGHYQAPDKRLLLMTETNLSPLDNLHIADPETYVWVKGRLELISPAPSGQVLSLLADETIWALSQEPGLGRAMAEGLLDLMDRGSQISLQTLQKFVVLVHRAAKTGATLGRLLATFAAPVLRGDGSLLDQFEKTLSIMLGKGTYTLSAPLEVMAELIAAGDDPSASVYLDLLATTFQQKISYNQSLRLVYLLPKAVRGFEPRRRRFQIEQLNKLARIDLQLVEPFVDGMPKGSGLLEAKALDAFTTAALDKFSHNPEAGIKFLNLTSQAGQNACAALQRAVPLMQVKGRLNRYLNARMGQSPTIKALSDLPGAHADHPWVCCDGRCIYLPAEIDCFENPLDNETLYKALIRLEAGYFECRTFDFDLERAADAYPEMSSWLQAHPSDDLQETLCDGERFVRAFSPAALAQDLFTLFEQARVAVHLNSSYPGLMRQVMPVMHLEAHKTGLLKTDHLLAPVFGKLVLGLEAFPATDPQSTSLQSRFVDLFYENIDESSPVEASARLVCMAFDHLRTVLGNRLNRYARLALPFARRIHWHLVTMAFAAQEQSAVQIKMRLKAKDLHLYRSDLRNRLAQRQGRLSADDIIELVLSRNDQTDLPKCVIDLSRLDLDALLNRSGVEPSILIQDQLKACRYPEWDNHLNDYLHEHTFVREVQVPAESDGDFYHRTLGQHHGLVARMRRAFELLKPEGLTILRQWPEGDAFDYRALIDFAIDRKAGRIPSDRLFIKRLKQERDVAVMLLVDISRSTVNPVAGGNATVLDVAKEALVIFCEALQVAGDDYAIAGFSGTGRHAVDFYGIKTFQEPLNEAVRARISALAPQRSTRMGAAIRHATALLAKAESRVRLVILVSDGFPNDLGYKADYAIADTRKAVQEARARNFHLKAITVNIGSDPRLDDLYGRKHHHVIGDVRELPSKLLRLYGTLTRF
jgi:nitric oxide reductase NorD protein